mmetsp:Transcript_33553/g.76708  ORF Transcript_33553/g.76708 Transcript_33553/m.76708 type:complete len:718 (-) Transcript_33553:432-2585(-)
MSSFDGLVGSFFRRFAVSEQDARDAVIVGDLRELQNYFLHDGDVNAKDSNGWSLLHHASFNSQFDSVRALLRKGADDQARDNEKRTPLDVAGNLEVRDLLSGKSNVGWSRERVLWLGHSSSESVLSCLKPMMLHRVISEACFGCTRIYDGLHLDLQNDMHTVVAQGNVGALAQRLDQGEELMGDTGSRERKYDGLTLLNVCILHTQGPKSVSIARILLAAGADPNKMDHAERRALDVACTHQPDNVALISLLLRSGAAHSPGHTCQVATGGCGPVALDLITRALDNLDDSVQEVEHLSVDEADRSVLSNATWLAERELEIGETLAMLRRDADYCFPGDQPRRELQDLLDSFNKQANKFSTFARVRLHIPLEGSTLSGTRASPSTSLALAAASRPHSPSPSPPRSRSRSRSPRASQGAGPKAGEAGGGGACSEDIFDLDELLVVHSPSSSTATVVSPGLRPAPPEFVEADRGRLESATLGMRCCSWTPTTPDAWSRDARDCSRSLGATPSWADAVRKEHGTTAPAGSLASAPSARPPLHSLPARLTPPQPHQQQKQPQRQSSGPPRAVQITEENRFLDVIDKKLWQSDDAVCSCPVCKREFKALHRRRHHCRGCGRVFCDSCCPKRVGVFAQGEKRVCSECVFQKTQRNTEAEEHEPTLSEFVEVSEASLASPARREPPAPRSGGCCGLPPHIIRGCSANLVDTPTSPATPLAPISPV